MEVKGLEVGEIIGLLMAKVEDDSKKVRILVISNENKIIAPVTEVGRNNKQVTIISNVNAPDTSTISVKEFLFLLYEHQSSDEVIFETYNADKTKRYVSSKIPKFSDIAVHEYIDRVEIDISIDKIEI